MAIAKLIMLVKVACSNGKLALIRPPPREVPWLGYNLYVAAFGIATIVPQSKTGVQRICIALGTLGRVHCGDHESENHQGGGSPTLKEISAILSRCKPLTTAADASGVPSDGVRWGSRCLF